MADNGDIVELVKKANRIEDVLEEMGVGLQAKHGRYLRSREHDSLVVDTANQAYFWNSKNENGDVIAWVERRHNCDFKTAVEFLARRAHLPDPEWGRQDMGARLAMRAREDVFTIVQRVLATWLWDPEALEYVRGRGWTDETIRASGIGFTGRSNSAGVGLVKNSGVAAAPVADLRGELAMHGHDPESPACVAILGFRGDVKGWGKRHNVEVQSNWVEWKLIPGLIGRTRLVYPHFVGGRVRYFSARNILGSEVNKEGREVKAFNLPVVLAGQRQAYLNFEYAPRAKECIVVEGQADAITLGQWGYAAVALAGTSWGDHAALIGELRERHEAIYLGLDGDEAGRQALLGRDGDWPLAQIFGPMGRIIQWPAAELQNGQHGKDANDWLKGMLLKGTEVEEQHALVKKQLAAAVPMALAAARWAGGQHGADQDRAFRTAFGIIGKMDRFMADRYREPMANALGMGVREFNNLLKAAREELGEKGKDRPGEIAEILGGSFGGWLVDYLYDPKRKETRFAYRDPEGKIGEAEELDIDGTRYIPKGPNDLVITGGVLFASEVGAPKSTRELVGMIEAFIHQHYLLDDRFFARLAAYYVMLTWIYDAFSAIPYLRAVGDYGSGKSQLMTRIGHLCYRMMSTGGAGTAASLFRALHQYRGTAFMDEMDLSDGGDMANDLIKILNLGAMKNNPVWRLDEFIGPDGTRDYEIKGYDIFGPKLIAMRGDFKDKAVASRCLTVKLMGKEPLELKKRGIRLHLDEAFYQQSLAIRNYLMRWRLEHWRPEIEVGEELMDLAVPARLNQVTMPLKALAQNDPELLRDITQFVRALNEELILERGMGLDARVMEGVAAILERPKYKPYLNEGACGTYGINKYTMIKHLTKVTNELIDEMNRTEGEEEERDEEGKTVRRRRELTSHKVGKIAREQLQLHSWRRADGYAVVLDEGKVEALKVKFGLSRPETEE